MGKKLIFSILLFFTFFSLIEAAPPVTTVQQFPEGLRIDVHPIKDFFKIGENVQFDIHVFNSSNGFPVNSSIICNFHLYSSEGEQLMLSQDTAEGYDYKFLVLGGNFTEETKSYHAFCYSSGVGGNYPYAIKVTYSGKELSISQSVLSIGFLSLLILIFIANFVAMSFLPAKNQVDEEGKILSITYLKYFRNVLWMMGYFLFIGIVYIASNLAYAFLSETLIADTLFMIFKVAFGLAPLIVIVWLIWIFVSMFHDKQFQKMLNRGIFPGGNL